MKLSSCMPLLLAGGLLLTTGRSCSNGALRRLS